jgi:hypothetical protein
MISTDLNRVAELANRLAERTLEALEHGRLTTEEFRESPDVALIFEAAKLLQAAGAEFPGGIVRLAQKGGRANADLMGSRPRAEHRRPSKSAPRAAPSCPKPPSLR